MSVEFDDVKFAPKRTVPAVVIENKKYQELLRLARIGAEAEKASKECNKELHGECTFADVGCQFVTVCKMVREGATVSESEKVAKELVVSKTEKTTSRMTAQQAIDLCRKYSNLE
mgnify:FL=1